MQARSECLFLLLLWAGAVHASDGDEPTTLATVEVRAPRVDPFAFHNPINYQPTRFDRDWRAQSPEQFAMSGGVVPWLNQKLGKGLSRMARGLGVRQQIQPAIARPSPLTDAQLDHAVEQMK